MQNGLGGASIGFSSDLNVSGSAHAGRYTEEDIIHLLYILEEEKLAGDVYDVFYETWGLQIFGNISVSEDAHYSALLKQAVKIGLDLDAFVFEPAGSYVNEDIQALYDSLIEYGSTSATAALEVGVMIETKDIVDLEEAAESVEGTVLEQIYANLLAGSENHLDAFEGHLIA